jgi:glycosyl transferase, family 25
VEWQTFDAVYVINLPERTDRRRELEYELNHVGLQGDDPRLVWIRAVRPADAGEFSSIGARGCFESHLTCLRNALEYGHGRILILEDDASFPQHRIEALRVVLMKLKSLNWAIWYGGGRMHGDLPAPISDADIVPIDHTVGVETTHCIALQGDAIRSVFTFFELILTRPSGHAEAGPMHVDGAYSTWRILNPHAVTLIAAPPVCLQRSSRSDIAMSRWYDSTPLIRTGIAALRRMRNRMNR